VVVQQQRHDHGAEGSPEAGAGPGEQRDRGDGGQPGAETDAGDDRQQADDPAVQRGERTQHESSW
jgi:hypothetical protein